MDKIIRAQNILGQHLYHLRSKGYHLNMIIKSEMQNRKDSMKSKSFSSKRISKTEQVNESRRESQRKRGRDTCASKAL